MKKLMSKFNFALISVMVAAPAFAADNNSALCGLIKRLSGVFGWIRNLAFIGAAFIIAAWAWDFIAAGKVEMKDIKTKGLGMLVGFLLLFMVGVLVNFLLGAASDGGSLGCADFNWDDFGKSFSK